MSAARATIRRRARAICAALLVACIVIPGTAATPARAVTDVDEYRGRLEDARKKVDAYIETGAIDGAGELAITVLTALPSIERVSVGDTVVVVDNSILRSLVARIDVSRDPERRLQIARDMKAHLGSIERSLPGDEDAVPADPGALAELLDQHRAQVRSPITEILGGLIDRLGEAFARWQSSIAESRSASRMLSFVIGLLILILFLLLAFTAWRVAVRVLGATARRGPAVADRSHSLPPVIASEAGVPADVVGFAEALAAEERFAEAVRALFGGAARVLAERGHVTRTRTRTNNELIAEVKAGVPHAAVPLRRLALSFERAFYGHVDPGPDGYRAALRDYRQLQAAATATATAAESGGEAA